MKSPAQSRLNQSLRASGTFQQHLKHTFIVALASLGSLSHAATVLWDGGGADTKWTTGTNWNGDVVPATASPYDDVTFGTNAKNTVDVDTNVTVNTLRFVSGGTSLYTIGNVGTASTITVGNGFAGSPDGTNDIQNLSAVLQTINANIIQNGATAVNASGGNITLNGTYNFNSGAQSRLMAGGGRTLVLNGQLTGATGTLAFNGGGIIEVRGTNNNYTAATNIWGGTVKLYNANSLGSSTSAINMGLSYNGGKLTASLLLSDAMTLSRNITLSSAHSQAESGNNPPLPSSSSYTAYTQHSFTFGGDTAQTSTFSGTITNSNNSQSNIAATVNFTAALNGRVNVANIIRGVNAARSEDDFNKIGLGTVAITGTLNNYQGTTNVNAGTLLVTGSLLANPSGKGVDVKASATFGGTGTVNRSVTLANLATLAAGDPTVSNGLGNFTIGAGTGAALTLAAAGGSILDFQISTGSDVNTANALQNMNTDGTLKWTDILANTGGLYAESAASNNDSVSILGDYVANTSGTTTVKLSASAIGPFTAGSVWDLMDWTGSNANATSSSYAFQVDSALQSALTAQGLSLDTSRFWDTGFIGITPEPGRGVLLMLGVSFFCLRRRRK